MLGCVFCNQVGCVLCRVQKTAQRGSWEQTNQTTTDGSSNLHQPDLPTGQRTLHVTAKACLEGTVFPNSVLQNMESPFPYTSYYHLYLFVIVYLLVVCEFTNQQGTQMVLHAKHAIRYTLASRSETIWQYLAYSH